MEESIALGQNIELHGFSEIDGGTALIVRKLIGNHGKKFFDRSENFGKLSLHLKTVHDNGNSKKFELSAKAVDNGKVYSSEIVDRNLFFAIDKVLKKLHSEMY